MKKRKSRRSRSRKRIQRKTY